MPPTLLILVRIEAVSRHKRDVFAESRPQPRLRVGALWHRYPQEETALRMRPRDFMREVVVQCLQHGVTPLAIDLSNQLHMLIEEAIPRNLVGHILIESGSMQVCGLFELHQLADDVLRRNDPGEPDSGRQGLRECAQIDDVAESESI